jgi:protein-L-isoaspartate(D-aspartate) O-methyltransferase
MNLQRLGIGFAFLTVFFWADFSVFLADGCAMSPSSPSGDATPAKASNMQTSAAALDNQRLAQARQKMVDDLRRVGIGDKQVLEAMGQVQRHCFVPDDRQDDAYADAALQIGHDQTISAPHIVALMTQLVQPSPNKRALDIGTGSGYQAAVLAKLCKQVYSIEIVEPLANEAQKRLASLGYANITVRCGDGYLGWAENAPFDIIVVAAAPDHVPQALVDQLAPGGRLIIPVGDDAQKLLLIDKDADGTVQRREVVTVKFVPMTGKAQNKQKNPI